MRVNIAMPVFRRPEYTRQVLEAIEAYLPKEWEIFVSVDRAKDGSFNQDVIDVFDDSPQATVHLAFEHGGCNGNVLNALTLAWSNAPDAVVCIEDDILISKDAGDYLQWALEKFKDDLSVRSVNLWEPATRNLASEFPSDNDSGRCILESGHFSCWGWGTWQREWEGIKANWTTGPDSHDTSWDVHLERYWGNRYEVAPLISRATNIGELLGTHRGAAQPSALADWDKTDYWLDESLTVRPQPRVYVILGAYGDIYMVCKAVPPGSIIATDINYASIIYEMFPDLEVYEMEGLGRNDLDTAMSMCAYKYPTRTIVLCQQDGQGQDVAKPFRNYQHFQVANAKL